MDLNDHLVTILQQEVLRTMKILHVLVGYLAVIALPFHPFAFAPPLAAIDYDGYVDTTQNHIDGALMNQVLGTILETCQTITTENHKDGTLMKRHGLPPAGDIIEARQLLTVIPVVGFVLYIIANVVLSIVWISNDDPVRGNDVVDLLVELFD